MEPQTFNPYQAPASDLGAGLEAPAEGQRLPLPFEDHLRYPGFWSRVGGMFQLLFSRPMELFERVEAGEGFVKPMLWSFLLSTPILLLTVVISLAFGALAFLPSTGRNDFPRWLPLFMAVGYPAFIIASQAAWMFLGGLLNHACLWMWGGLKHNAGLQHTLRAQGYFQGFFMLAYLIPLLNILVALAGPALLGMGLARLHRTDTWRGVCAAYTPFLLCCVLYAGFIMVAIGAASFLGPR
jgi:hypothetical protein